MTQKQVLTIPFTGGLAGKVAEQIRPPGANFLATNVRQAKAGEWRNSPSLFLWGGSGRVGQNYSVLAPLATGGTGQARSIAGFAANVGANVATPTNTVLNCVEFLDVANAVNASGTATTTDCLACPSVWTRRAEAYDPFVNLGTGVYQNPTIIAFATNGDATKPIDCIAWTSGTQAYVTFIDVLTGAVLYRNNLGAYSNVKVTYCSSSQFLVCALSGGSIDAYSWLVAGNSTPSVQSFPAAVTGVTNSNFDVQWTGNSGFALIAVSASPNTKTLLLNAINGATVGPNTVAVAGDKCISILENNYTTTNYYVACGTTGALAVVKLNSSGAFVSSNAAAAFTPLAATGVCLPTADDWLLAIDDTNRLWTNAKLAGVVGSPTLFSPGATSWLHLETKAWSAVAPNNANARMHFIGGLHVQVPTDPQDSYYELVYTPALGASLQIQSVILPLQAGAAPRVNGDLRQVSKRGTYSWAWAGTHSLNFSSTAASGIVYNLGISTFTTAVKTAPIVTSPVWSQFLNAGSPAQLGQTTYVPVGPGKMVAGNGVYNIGPLTIPLRPVLAQSAGGALTLLGTYLYRFVNVLVDPFGNVYRSPPSVATSITLTGANATVTVSVPYCPDNGGNGVANHVKTEVYRTAAGSTVFQKVTEVIAPYGWGNDAGTTVVDAASDVSLASGDFLYSTGEVQNAIPPRPAHICVTNKRMWVVDADFPQVVRFTKTFRKGFLPEFVDGFYVDLTDDKGVITGIQPLDDRVVVFKSNAIYVISGDGPDLTGAGPNPAFTRVVTDCGSLPGPLQCSTGSEVYFAAPGQGVWKIDRSLTVTYAGAALDDYLVTAPTAPSLYGSAETLQQAFVVQDRNEVWFIGQSTAYIYDLINGCWMTQLIPLTVGGAVTVSAAYDGAHVIIAEGATADGAFSLYSDDLTNTAFPATNQLASWRTAWIEPSQGMDSWIRLWRIRVLGQQGFSSASGGTATITITVDFDKDGAATNAKRISRTSTLNAAGNPTGELPYFDGELRLHRRCSSFRVTVTIAAGASWQLRFEGLSAELGMLAGMRRLAPANRMA